MALEGVTGGGGGVAISYPTIIISATLQGSSHGVNSVGGQGLAARRGHQTITSGRYLVYFGLDY